jgi:hypothetical protein
MLAKKGKIKKTNYIKKSQINISINCLSIILVPLTVCLFQNSQKIYELARGVEIWIGLVKEQENDEQVWKWVDEIGEPRFVRWTSGQPNSFKSDENCAMLMNRHVNDVPCHYKLPFICQA